MALKMAGSNVARNPNCIGENVSPALTWSIPPAGTNSLALLMFDLGGATEGWSAERGEPLGRLWHTDLSHRLCSGRGYQREQQVCQWQEPDGAWVTISALVRRPALRTTTLSC